MILLIPFPLLCNNLGKAHMLARAQTICAVALGLCALVTLLLCLRRIHSVRLVAYLRAVMNSIFHTVKKGLFLLFSLSLSYAFFPQHAMRLQAASHVISSHPPAVSSKVSSSPYW